MINFFQDIGVEGQTNNELFIFSSIFRETLVCVYRLQEIYKMKKYN